MSATDLPPAKWPGSLSDRERFLRQMRFQPVDRCFNREFGFWNDNFTLWPMFRERGIADNGTAERWLNFDDIRVEGARDMLPRFEEKVLAERNGIRVIQNADGLTAEVPADGHDTIPHYIKSSVETPEDWAKVKAERFRPDDPARRVDVEALKRRHPVDRDYVLMVDAGSRIGRIRDLLTVEGLAYACQDYPEMVDDMVETWCQLTEQYLDQVLPHLSFDAAGGWEDICYKNGPLISLGFFREVVIPRVRRIGAKLHAAGIDIWFTDCDGDVRPLLEDWMAAGQNTLFPLEVNGSGHPGALLDRYPGELRVMGGVDKMMLIRGRGAIREYLESLVPWVERGGFIPHVDHRCPPDVSQENYLFYLEEKKRLFCREIGA
jgi:uroporphyrinogen decarboxylase